MSWVFILGLLAIMLAVVSSGQSGAEIKSWNAFKTLVHPETGRVHSTRNDTPEPLLVKSDRVIAIIEAPPSLTRGRVWAVAREAGA